MLVVSTRLIFITVGGASFVFYSYVDYVVTFFSFLLRSVNPVRSLERKAMILTNTMKHLRKMMSRKNSQEKETQLPQVRSQKPQSLMTGKFQVRLFRYGIYCRYYVLS